MSRARAFTLIELLVVIAIIGLLSSIVLASLNSARAKGSIAAIKSNMRNMISAAELSYDSVSPNSYSGACAGVAGMITAITNAGGTASCYSYDNTRWGVTAKLNSDSTKNYSVDSSVVVTWDAADVSGSVMGWGGAVSACATAGGQLPTFEQLKTISMTYAPTMPPPGFQAAYWYWSRTEDPANSANAYIVHMGNGGMGSTNKGGSFYVHCVR